MAKRITRRELLKLGAIAGAALSVPFIHHRYANAAGEIDPAVTRSFGSGLKGRLIVPGDVEYNSARRVWNWRYDEHPAMIAQCAVTDDVRRSVEFARKRHLRAAIRSGGHSFSGYSTCDGGLVIDLSPMKRVQVESGKTGRPRGARYSNRGIRQRCRAIRSVGVDGRMSRHRPRRTHPRRRKRMARDSLWNRQRQPHFGRSSDRGWRCGVR